MKQCFICKNAVFDDTQICPYCQSKAFTPLSTQSSLPIPAVLMYILSFLIPVAGFVFFAITLKNNRSAALTCLALALTGMVFSLVYAIWVNLDTIMQLIGLLTMMQ